MSETEKIIKKIIYLQQKLFIPIHVDQPERFEDWDEHKLKLYLRATELLLTENTQ